jgi:hypothetical protein
MNVFIWILTALLLLNIIFQVRSRIPQIISFFSPGNRKLYFQDSAQPPISDIHQEMVKPVFEKLEAQGFKQMGLMLEKPPLWARSSREMVLVAPEKKIIASVGFRGLKLSYFFYTPFKGGQVVITAYNSFRNFNKKDFATAVVNSGDIAEMLEVHKNAVDNFVASGFIPFDEYTHEAVISATIQYYKSPYPRRQLLIAGITNSAFFVLSVAAFIIALRSVILSWMGS